MRRLSRVDLPAPEGPDRTMGRSLEEVEEEELCVVGRIVRNVQATGPEEETHSERGCEVNDDDVLEAVKSEVEAILGLGENFRLGQALGFGFRRRVKL
jgi:hypothetical protein